MTHKFWGTVTEGWAGFSSEVKLSTPHFSNGEIAVFLGEELDEDGEYIEVSPSLSDLDQLQLTYEQFCSSIADIMNEMREKSFQRYLAIYAKSYATPP